MSKVIKGKALAVLFFLFLGLIAPAATAEESLLFTLNPGVINVGPRFHGATLEITGTAPAGSDIYLKIISPPRKERLNKKGRVGFLWMNIAQAEVDNIPKMYMVYSSAPLERLSSDLQEKIGIDPYFTAVRGQVIITEKREGKSKTLTGEEGKEYLDALIGMYQKRGLYVIGESAITTRIENNLTSFTLKVPLPAEVAQGTSTVTVYAVKDGKITAESSGTFTVQPAGIVGVVRKLAKMEGPLYGTLAVFIALIAGVAIDFLFSSLEKLWRNSLRSGKAAQPKGDFIVETH